jgi:hypothetical protein
MQEYIGDVLIGIGIVILITFIGREVALWYWKVNKIVSLLEKIEKNTNKDSTKEG